MLGNLVQRQRSQHIHEYFLYGDVCKDPTRLPHLLSRVPLPCLLMLSIEGHPHSRMLQPFLVKPHFTPRRPRGASLQTPQIARRGLSVAVRALISSSTHCETCIAAALLAPLPPSPACPMTLRPLTHDLGEPVMSSVECLSLTPSRVSTKITRDHSTMQLT